MSVYYQDERVTLHHGDALDVLRGLPDESVHAIVTDPPAGISFMGKDWDGAKGGREQWSAWLAEVMREAYRVTKPGGHALVWALPRTSHWTACGLEDAGWEIRDKIVHLFGTGFPKSLDVSKAIDKAAGAEREDARHPGFSPFGSGSPRCVTCGRTKGSQPGNCRCVDERSAPATPDAERWQGWGTALKPAAEDWWLARKPLAGTVAANVLEHGTGALNIDGCRVGVSDADRENVRGRKFVGKPQSSDIYAQDEWTKNNMGGIRDIAYHAAGRWPANVVLDDSQAAELDEQSGESSSGGRSWKAGDEDTASWRNLEGRDKPATRSDYARGADSGGASRFFPTFRYEAKAPSSERPRYTRPMLRLRDDLTPEQVDHVRARLAEAGVQVD